MIGRAALAAALAGFLSSAAAGGAEAGPSLVVDYATGRVLHAEEATRPWYPASLSKLMTAYVVFKAIRDGKISGDTPIVISKRAAKMAPSKMGYPPGTLVTVDDALKMLVVHSANDIAVALAEGVSGSVEAFAREMNVESRALGMAQSHWVNPNGLPDPGQISSAHDMAILARTILSEFPQYAHLYSIQAIQSGDRVMRTHNALVYRYPGTDGMKTGFICAAGFNLVATAVRGDRRLITVVMGSPSAKERTLEAVQLFEDNFATATPTASIFGGGARSLADLPASKYTVPPDIRNIACNRKKGGSAAAESEDTAEVTPPENRPQGVLAFLNPAQQTPRRAEDALLDTWVLNPPIVVGPYTGPLKPKATPTATSAAAPVAAADPAPLPPAAAPAKPGAIDDGVPAGTPVSPVAATPGAPLALPGTALGAIRPGGAPGETDRPAPGQIRRAKGAKPKVLAPAAAAADAPVPTPVPVPRPKKKPKVLPAG